MALPNVNLQPGQSVTVNALAEDANSNPATLATKPSWSRPSGIGVNTAGDGMSAIITAGSTPGTFQVDVTFTAVAAGPTITSSFTVTVAELPATQLVFTFGTPTG